MTIWDGVHESMHREQLWELQLERLRAMVDRVYEQVPFYRHKLTEAGFEPGDLRDLDDLRGLPFTIKDDFRDNYPTACSPPLDEVVEIHSSSGTTGGRWWRASPATTCTPGRSSCAACGRRRGPRRRSSGLLRLRHVHGRLRAHYGLAARRRGGAAHQRRQHGAPVTVHAGLRHHGADRHAQLRPVHGRGDRQARLDPASLKLRLGLFGAEACSDQLRAQIEARLPIFATDNYGLTEVIGPGVAGECEHRDGMHIDEDHFLVECLDPVTGEPVGDGQVGELVFTAMTRRVLTGAALPHR